MARPVEELLKTMGIVPHHIDLYAQALTHSSKNGVSNRRFDYERLEFLGDAVLELITSKTLYEHFPQMREGEMTKRRAKKPYRIL